MNPFFGVLIALAVVALIGASWYFAWIKPSLDRKEIANNTPTDVQIQRFERIFNGNVEVYIRRAEFALRDEDLQSIATRHGYTFARYFQTNRGDPNEMIFRRIDAGRGRRFGSARSK